jgi:hypothetical protein
MGRVFTAPLYIEKFGGVHIRFRPARRTAKAWS